MDEGELTARIVTILDPAHEEAHRLTLEEMLAPWQRELEEMIGRLGPGDRLELQMGPRECRIAIVSAKP